MLPSHPVSHMYMTGFKLRVPQGERTATAGPLLTMHNMYSVCMLKYKMALYLLHADVINYKLLQESATNLP